MAARGRRKTDKSLGAERAEADSKMKMSHARNQDAADDSVGVKRASVDRKQTKGRVAADAKLASERKKPNGSLAAERQRADERLEAERSAADRNLEGERANVDATKVIERAASKKDAEELFRKERHATDRDLSRERDWADETGRRAHAMHSSESAAHELTRNALSLRDEFLIVLGQHLRSPMLGISVAANELKDMGRKNGSDSAQRREVEVIARSAEAMLRVLGDLHERVALWGEDSPPPPALAADRTDAPSKTRAAPRSVASTTGRKKSGSASRKSKPSKAKSTSRARGKKRG